MENYCKYMERKYKFLLFSIFKEILYNKIFYIILLSKRNLNKVI